MTHNPCIGLTNGTAAVGGQGFLGVPFGNCQEKLGDQLGRVMRKRV